LLGRNWYPIEGIFGLLPLIYGSLLVTFLAITIALPLGLATAIYLGQMAPEWLRDILKPLIEILAGIPSIVLGFLGWVALAPIIQRAGAPTGLTAFTGGLILAYMALPTIISIAEDAIDAVPKAYREGARAISATEWQTTYRMVLPAARSGLVTAVMLGIGRAIGDDGGLDGDQRRQHAVREPDAVRAGAHHDRHCGEMGEVAQGSRTITCCSESRSCSS
jgi:phosphate transport system permease protein